MERVFFTLSGVIGFLAVALGAFGAHGLKARLSGAPDFVQRMDWWQTAAQYHLAHALALGLVALLCGRVAPGVTALAHASGYLFLAGVLLFSGSLYMMTLTGIRPLGAVTPLGGLCLLSGWAALAVVAWRGL